MFAFALKNMLRYKSRSTITLIVIIVTAFTSLLTMGFMEGLINLTMDSFIRFQTAHIRITSPEYYEDIRFKPVHEYIDNIGELTNSLQKYSEIERIVPSFNIFGLVSKKGETYQSRGIALPFGNNAYDFPNILIEGEENSLIIGEGFKEKIQADLGDELLVATTSVEGGLNAVKPSIGGISKFNISSFDNNMFFIDLPIAQKLLKAPDSATEIYIYLKDQSQTLSMVKKLQKDFPQLSIQSYYRQLGAMALVIEVQKRMLVFFAMFIMILGSLSIVNSIVASIYDRINELGTLKAIGYSDKELGTMLVYEGLIYGVIGGTIGFILGFVLLQSFSQNGLDFSNMLSNTNLPIKPILYPKVEPLVYVMAYLISVLIPALVALIPQKHIQAITPVDALRS